MCICGYIGNYTQINTCGLCINIRYTNKYLYNYAYSHK